MDASINILVQRFKDLYWPSWLEEFTLSLVLATPPMSYFGEEERDEAYDLGRIHYFINQLKAGEPLTPVVVDWIWFGNSPARIDLLDGHHRYVACVLNGEKWLPVSYGGPLDVLPWLTGAVGMSSPIGCERNTTMKNTNQPVPRIPATQWLQEYAVAKAKQDEAVRIERERAIEKMKADASRVVDVFMLMVSEGKNPWTKPPRSELNLGAGEVAVLTLAKEELISLGYKARVDHPTNTGPGGRGELEVTWTDEDSWCLYVERPCISRLMTRNTRPFLAGQ